MHEQAEARRGTHAAKTRAAVSGSGKKLWKQKGTGRARVSDLRNPLWRKGGVVFPPQPRDYAFALPKKVRRGALREALAFKAQAGHADDRRCAANRHREDEGRGGAAQGAGRERQDAGARPRAERACWICATRNIAGLPISPANRISARAVVDATRVIATRAALEKLQDALRS